MIRGVGKSRPFQAIRGAALSVFVALPLCASAKDIDLVDATLVDGTGAPPRAGVTVSIRDRKIAAITGTLPAPASGVRRIDLARRYLLPGLSDAHAHIESPAAALRALKSGVTTARVLGDTYRQAIIEHIDDRKDPR